MVGCGSYEEFCLSVNTSISKVVDSGIKFYCLLYDRDSSMLSTEDNEYIWWGLYANAFG